MVYMIPKAVHEELEVLEKKQFLMDHVKVTVVD